MPLLIGCTEKSKYPLIKSLDLSGAIGVGYFYDFYRKDKDFYEKDVDSKNIYKFYDNGNVERIKIKTENSDDGYPDLEYGFELVDASKDYFFLKANYSSDDCYLISKKNGNALKIDNSYSIYELGAHNWSFSTSTRKDFPQDKDGNMYALVQDITKYKILKFSVGDNGKVNQKLVSLKDDEIYKNIDLPYSVDKDGNLAYTVLNGKNSSCKLVTSDGRSLDLPGPNKFTVDSEEITVNYRQFWQGYDGLIYSLNNNTVERLVYIYDSNGLISSASFETIATLEGLNQLPIQTEKVLAMDGVQEIYYYDRNTQSGELYLYKLYSNDMSNPSITYKLDDLNKYEYYRSDENEIWWDHRAFLHSTDKYIYYYSDSYICRLDVSDDFALEKRDMFTDNIRAYKHTNDGKIIYVYGKDYSISVYDYQNDIMYNEGCCTNLMNWVHIVTIDN